MQHLPETNPIVSEITGDGLWAWAKEHYARPGTADLLIDCQDRFDLNINVLLWCSWCAEQYRLLSELEIRSALDVGQTWANEITIPLRKARRALKMPRFRNYASCHDGFYEKIKDVELTSEKMELELYENVGDRARTVPTGDIFTIARRNTSTYLAFTEAPRMEGFSVSLIDDVVLHLLGSTQS